MALPQIDSLKTPDASLSRAASPRRGRLPLINLPFVAIIVLLVGYGLLVCWSSIEGSNDTTYSFTRQLLFAAVGAVVMILMWRVDYQRFANAVMPLFIVNIALILSPHIPGLGTDAGMGAQSWLKLGIQVQPGEFAKITIILMDAALVARYGGRLDDLREYLKVVFFILVPFLAIMTQPDLGTGLVYLAIGAMALVAGGARPKYLLITLALGIAAIAAMFAIDQLIYNSTGEYKLLKQYQRNRLLVFLTRTARTRRRRDITSSRRRSPSARAGFSERACSTPHSRGTAFCPRRRPTSSSACLPSSSASWGRWHCSRSTVRSST